MEEQKEATNVAQDMNSRFDELIAQMEELGASNHGYSKDSMITIPGSLYVTFLNMVSHIKATLDGLDKTLGINEDVLAQARQAIAVLNNNAATMTIQLMEQHVTNIKAGSTISQELLDAEDAVEKIQEIGN